MKLTISDLKKHRACEAQVELFREHFGSGGTVTLAKVRKVAHLFDWDWAAQHLLSEASEAEYQSAIAPAWAEYDRVRAPAWAEYERVTAPAWVEYDRATAPALAEYKRAKASALAEYQRAIAPALAEYNRAIDPALTEYQRAKASAWFAGWKKDHVSD